jgi:hypothetical protein
VIHLSAAFCLFVRIRTFPIVYPPESCFLHMQYWSDRGPRWSHFPLRAQIDHHSSNVRVNVMLRLRARVRWERNLSRAPGGGALMIRVHQIKTHSRRQGGEQ